MFHLFKHKAEARAKEVEIVDLRGIEKVNGIAPGIAALGIGFSPLVTDVASSLESWLPMIIELAMFTVIIGLIFKMTRKMGGD
ncbi:MAG: hypothetical protein HPY73_05695 [Methanomassiliicoccales archaeon]|nr:MAG: hypothetical protein HPY73_05695 [Methanomassiliicoccales archaeon]